MWGCITPSLSQIDEFMRTEQSGRPILLEEYTHSLGNGNGNSTFAFGRYFGDIPNDGVWCQDRILFPDRTPKPALHEFRKINQPISIYAINPEEGQYLLTNRYSFLTSDFMELHWSLEQEGKVLWEGTIEDFILNPLEKRELVWKPALNHKGRGILAAVFLSSEAGHAMGVKGI